VVGHGPILEEDIATANIALDLIGQAAQLLKLAGELEGAGRDEDALAYFRDGTRSQRLLVELPRGDFGDTMLRQFLFDAYSVLLLDALTRAGTRSGGDCGQVAQGVQVPPAAQQRVGGALGDGTEESHARVQASLDRSGVHGGAVRPSDAWTPRWRPTASCGSRPRSSRAGTRW
jgi:ring-1,2-phenylacetyl-CoA epoxidase subunit PaaC